MDQREGGDEREMRQQEVPVVVHRPLVVEEGEAEGGGGEVEVNGRFSLHPYLDPIVPAAQEEGVLRNENADGFYDYTSGLVPDITLGEDLTNLGVLGDVNEPLLARALQEISGGSAKIDFTVEMPAESFTSSRLHTPVKDNMYLDKPLKFNKY